MVRLFIFAAPLHEYNNIHHHHFYHIMQVDRVVLNRQRTNPAPIQTIRTSLLSQIKVAPRPRLRTPQPGMPAHNPAQVVRITTVVNLETQAQGAPAAVVVTAMAVLGALKTILPIPHQPVMINSHPNSLRLKIMAPKVLQMEVDEMVVMVRLIILSFPPFSFPSLLIVLSLPPSDLKHTERVSDGASFYRS